MMLLPILLIVVLYFVVTGDQKNFFTSKVDESERLLKERFVNGEIDEETFKRMKSVLKK